MADDVITSNGIRWTLAPDAKSQFGDEVPHLPQWIANGCAEVVKSGPHRAVYRVLLPQLRLYWKHCKLATIRAFLREVIRPPKARMEFDKAIALKERNVPTFEPLAWGIRPGFIPGESFLITRALENAVSVQQYLEGSLTPKSRREIAVALGQFIALLHNAGVTHPDLHPGNILIGAESEFYLLDLHAIRLGEPLNTSASHANLVMLNRWFAIRATRSDRLRFWRSYTAHRPKVASLNPREIETLTSRSNERFWRSREWRYTSSNRYFRKVKSPIASGFVVRDFDAATLEQLLADPDAPFRTAKIIKDSRSSTVAIWNIGDHTVIYKRFRLRKKLDPWLNMVRPSATLRSWCRGQSLRERHLRTPRPLLMLHRRRRGLPAEGYLLTEFVADARELHSELSACGDHRPLIDELARCIRILHERQLSHRDLKANNLLVDAQGKIHFIDLVGVRDHRKLSRSRRVQNLARLNASFLHRPEVTRTDRLRFLRMYLSWAMNGKTGWKLWWREVGQLTQKKVARNRRSGRPLA